MRIAILKDKNLESMGKWCYYAHKYNWWFKLFGTKIGLSYVTGPQKDELSCIERVKELYGEKFELVRIVEVEI